MLNSIKTKLLHGRYASFFKTIASAEYNKVDDFMQSKSIDVNRPFKGKFPLEFCIDVIEETSSPQSEGLDIFDMLIQSGADINLVSDETYDNVFHYAVMHLLTLKTQYNQSTFQKVWATTATKELIDYILRRDLELFFFLDPYQYLLKLPINCNNVDFMEKTLVDLSRQAEMETDVFYFDFPYDNEDNFEKIASVLIELGASARVKNNRGETIKDIAKNRSLDTLLSTIKEYQTVQHETLSI
ncbi:MAG: hypothetical protein HOG49_13370 [Candidatus Scalindua sp.]|nr:hypothetical protein [Candidatus Scalindua sp.]